ncbi:MAG: hypothetical protein QNL11_04045 [Desulfobacterales bacterium]|jgi:hypothetical protein|nr:hypothetical protein [Desulfobacterales bacterium]
MALQKCKDWISNFSSSTKNNPSCGTSVNEKRMRVGCLGLIIILFGFSISTVYAGSPYIRNSIGESSKTKGKDSFPCVPVSSWVGERFLFAPREKYLQGYGYQELRFNDEGFGSRTLNYDEYVGRIAVLKSVFLPYSISLWEITFEMEDNSEKLVLKYVTECPRLKHLIPIRVLDKARNKWKGKTLWLKEKTTLGTYDEESGKYDSFLGEKHSSVKVIDVVAGWNNSRPVRFILKTKSGKVGFLDVVTSGMNWRLPENYEFEPDYFEKYFLVEII